MSEKPKSMNINKRLTEEDMATLLQSYSASTIITLLQEVAQVARKQKFDWDELVRNTATGITNAREYQMLWRHLAYRHELDDKLDDESVPLDDDSDSETELEVFPPMSAEAAAEASACVKVLIASGVSSDPTMPNGSTVEAPLTINIPSGQTSRTAAENSSYGMNGTNITVPVSVQKLVPSTVNPNEGLDNNGPASANLPPRRKRKPWSSSEDLELIAAVQRCGEGNWANILKGDFKGDRTASQLSQRWAIIRKRNGNVVGNGLQPSEAQLAANHAVSLALDMPRGDNLKAASPISNNGVAQNSGGILGSSTHPATTDIASTITQIQHQQIQHQQDSVASKPRLVPKKPSQPKPTMTPDAMVKATAVAAGARIATPSDAASLLKAAQSKNAVHIMPGGGPPTKSSVPTISTSGLPSNVHFISTGLLSHPSGPSNASRPGAQLLAQGHTLRPVSLTVKANSAGTPSRLSASIEVPNVLSAPAAPREVKTKQEILQVVQAQGEKLVGDLAALKVVKQEDEVRDMLIDPPSREVATCCKADGESENLNENNTIDAAVGNVSGQSPEAETGNLLEGSDRDMEI